MNDLARIARTVRHMEPMQVAHRIRLRAKKLAYARLPPEALADRYRVDGAAAGWPGDFRPIDRVAHPEPTTVEQIARREFVLVGETHRIAEPDDWSPLDMSQLWRYHLHYLEWAWPLVEEGRPCRGLFTERWSEWNEATTIGRWDAWSPYVVSVRAWTMCALFAGLVRGSTIETEYVDSLRVHAGYVRANLELDVGGNHLIKNLKGLVGLGVFFDEDTLIGVAERHLEQQIRIQVLADGGHFERSPSYHAQVLGDLIDIAGLRAAAGLRPIPSLDDAVVRMRFWLGNLLLPDGTVPLLKDCVPVPSRRLDALQPSPAAGDRCTRLLDSGYVIVRTGPFHAVLDVGQPCPPSLPAHAHADSLNWVLCVDGEPTIVDTGTSTYQDLSRRAIERSTASHNTVTVDGDDSTEVYGAFRAGRRATVQVMDITDSFDAVEVVAEHDGYRHLEDSPIHRRTWRITNDAIVVTDRIEGSWPHQVIVRHNVARESADRIDITTTPGSRSRRTTEFAAGMGVRIQGVQHYASTIAGPAGELTTVIRRTPGVV